MDAHDAPAGTLCWHIHHDVLLEVAWKTLDFRADVIRELKLAEEHETRLRLMKPVAGELPREVVEAARKYYEAWSAVEEIEEDANGGNLLGDDYIAKVNAEYERCIKFKAAVQCHQAEVDALHDAECPDCPWDGETIFPKEARP